MLEQEGKGFLTIEEVADLLRVSKATIYNYLKRGKLQSRRVGRRRLFAREDIVALVGDEPLYEPSKEPSIPDAVRDEIRQTLQQADELRRKGASDEIFRLLKPFMVKLSRSELVAEYANALYLQGAAYLNSGNHLKATKTLQKANSIVVNTDDRLLEGKICGTTGMIALRQRNYDSALTNYHQAARIFQEINAKEQLAITYQNLGVVYRALNRLRESLAHYKLALETSNPLKMPINFKPQLILSLSETYHTLGDASRAFAYDEKAYKLGLRTGRKVTICVATNGMGRTSWDLGDTTSARDYFRMSLEAWEELDEKVQQQWLSMPINSLIILEDFSRCLELLDRKYALLTKDGAIPPDLTGTLHNYAKCYLGLKQPEKAIEYAERALDTMNTLAQLASQWSVLKLLGRCHAAAGHTRKACEYYAEAMFHLTGEMDSIEIMDEHSGLHPNMEGLIDYYNISITQLDDDTLAVAHITALIAQKTSRAIIENNIEPDPVGTRSEARKLIRNKSIIDDYFLKMGQVPPGKMKPSMVQSQIERLARIRENRKKFIQNLSHDNPLFLPLQGEGGPDVPEIIKLFRDGKLPSGGAVLLLYIAKDAGEGILINEKGVAIRRKLDIGSARVKGHIDRFISACAGFGSSIEDGIAPPLDEQKYVKGILKVLYEKLIRPFSDTFNPDAPLLIVTNGPLSFLPFDALFDGTRYLCEYLNISRILSPALLRALRPAAYNKKIPENGKLLIATPFIDTNQPNPLGFAGSIPSRSKVEFYNDEAIVGNVRPNLTKVRAFLYAGEYRYFPRNSDRSNLVMSSGLGLSAHDLFTQRYDLSDLDSAILYTGGVSREELNELHPFLPIQRSLQSAGVGNVSTFLWKMDPPSLSNLLNRLYSDFATTDLTGKTRIQEVQKKLIDNPLTSHPYFWAGILTISLP